MAFYKAGAVGFHMGGGIALSVTGTYPDRFVAGASLQGGNLATDPSTSPHLFAPKLQARVYFAAVKNDRSDTPDMADRLDKALVQAGVRYSTDT